MTKDARHGARRRGQMEEAKRLLHQRRIEKILVVDEAYRCVGLITVKDIEKAQKFPNACKDERRGACAWRRRPASAKTASSAPMALVEAECDVVVVDTAHGHSAACWRNGAPHQARKQLHASGGRQCGHARRRQALIDAGRRCDQGRHRPGLDLHHAHRGRRRRAAADRDHGGGRRPRDAADVPVIGDGGIAIRAIWPRRSPAAPMCAMVGSLLAGTDESPGEVFLYQGRSYKGLSRHGLARRDGARLGRSLFPGRIVKRSRSSSCRKASRARCPIAGRPAQ
jgi:IMP dehydrogenase